MTKTHILVVEDEPICVALIKHTLEAKGHSIIAANSCADAWQHLQSQEYEFDAILLDRGLPDQDGLELLRQLKATPALKNIPVIVETASADDESIREGLRNGAYYYLTKPLNTDLLVSIVNASINQHRSEKTLRALVKLKEQTYLHHLSHAVFHYRTLDEARTLTQTLSQLCPDPERVVIGLQELLVNAVEHGNLGISYADKTRLILKSQWQEEVEIRQALPEYSTRRVEIRFQRHATYIVITIQDEGSGFDWGKYLQLDAERAFDPHGRGIAMANMLSFDNINYLGNGNTVEVRIDC